MIPAMYLASLGAILFCIGLMGVFTNKNGIIVLMCVEIMLNAVNLNFVAGAPVSYTHLTLPTKA